MNGACLHVACLHEARRTALSGVVRWTAVGVLLAGLAGCGVRPSSLDKPADEVVSPNASATSGQGKPAGATGKPHEGFILDGLIR